LRVTVSRPINPEVQPGKSASEVSSEALRSRAAHAGPITASRTTLVTINPLVSIVLGITLFADHLRTGPLWISLEIAALAVLVAGVVILARSPLVAGTQSEGDPGEMLGGARKRALEGVESVAAGTAGLPGTPVVDPIVPLGGGPAG